ncbi:acetate--CoA ligase [Dryocola sp. LX212]
MKNEPCQNHINVNTYSEQYRISTLDPEKYWEDEAKKLDWIIPFKSVKNISSSSENVSIKWFEDGSLNVSQNCLDRHLYSRGNKIALIWESEDGKESKKFTYRELFDEVCRFAGVLRKLGVKKGDAVAIYMPMLPETLIAMLACTRIGAMHCVVFGGFSAASLAERISDVKASVVVTADEGRRAGKTFPLKNQVDQAIAVCCTKEGHTVEKVIVLENTGQEIQWKKDRDFWWDAMMSTAESVMEPVAMQAEDPLFVLYTSGSTGKPKGILHTTGGYLTQAATTFRNLFQKNEDDVFWCTADVGWITGHTYLVYAPLCCGVSTVMHEGVPSWPTPDILARIIDKHSVNVLYTAPTVIRSLMAKGDEALGKTKRTSLHTLGSVGEPINPEAWMWYWKTFGHSKCSVMDTWWQTETGGIMIAPQFEGGHIKPGCAATPCFGISLAVKNDAGEDVNFGEKGYLVIQDSWPGQARSIWGNHQRFVDSYYNVIPGVYYTGDGAFQDHEGHFWVTGRVDDVMNISGHRLGAVEIESAISSHPSVSEAAVVGIPHPIKGECIYAFVTLQHGVTAQDGLSSELRALVRLTIGPIATPEVIHWTPHIPKTRSGKILRRVLRKIAVGDSENLGDITTLSDPDAISKLLQELKHQNETNHQ